MQAWRWISLASIVAGGACGAEAEPTGKANPESIVRDDDVMGHKCEGPDGRECPGSKFCATAKTNHCPSTKVQGTCRSIPEACADSYQPTCGCDGQTYGNECQAGVAGVAVAYDGACAPSCGGFAGLPCPGEGTCVDNETDGCDPLVGDSDCASLCRCEVAGLCNEGGRWDSSPEVCACVWD